MTGEREEYRRIYCKETRTIGNVQLRCGYGPYKHTEGIHWDEFFDLDWRNHSTHPSQINTGSGRNYPAEATGTQPANTPGQTTVEEQIAEAITGYAAKEPVAEVTIIYPDDPDIRT
jgi:hypothetical protein